MAGMRRGKQKQKVAWQGIIEMGTELWVPRLRSEVWAWGGQGLHFLPAVPSPLLSTAACRPWSYLLLLTASLAVALPVGAASHSTPRTTLVLAGGSHHQPGAGWHQLPSSFTSQAPTFPLPWVLQYRSSNPMVEAEYQFYPTAGRLTSLCKGAARGAVTAAARRAGVPCVQAEGCGWCAPQALTLLLALHSRSAAHPPVLPPP